MARYYITTPLYYVNDLPHIGHAYTTLAVDIFSRAMRLYGHEVRFLTGTDEHGSKVAQSAAARGETPIVFSDRVSQAFRDTWSKLNIQYDDFIRTTEPRHESVVQGIFKQLQDSGDIYKGSYEGWYCTPCETFWSEEELGESKNCLTCARPVERLKEETYFFKLSKYQDPLLEAYGKNASFLSPKHRAKEIETFVKGGLRELSVSRVASRVGWGIPVPGDPSQTIYVWFDALINYISALGFSHESAKSSDKLFVDYWQENHNRIHVVGKEIYRFHTVTWPGVLMAANIPLPSKVFAHGWWTVEGEKMSKSKGNVVNPVDIIEKEGIPLDALRYYLFREMSFGSDGDFSLARLKSKIDGELANNFGNLHRRLISMIEKYLGGRVEKKGALGCFYGLLSLAKDPGGAEKMYEDMEFHKVLDSIYSGFVRINGIIDQGAPWRLAKEDKKEELESLLFDTALSLALLCYLLSPVCPDSCKKVIESLGLKFSPEEGFVKYLAGITSLQVRLTDPLFPRTEALK